MKPLRPIRRPDVFAQYNRLEKMEEGMLPDEAKSYALWVARIAAADGDVSRKRCLQQGFWLTHRSRLSLRIWLSRHFTLRRSTHECVKEVPGIAKAGKAKRLPDFA
jgi:hypothetical protein